MKAKLFFIISLLLVNHLTAQERLSVQDAVRTALERNFDIQVAEVSFEKARMNNTPGNAGLLPAATLTGNGVLRYDSDAQGNYSTAGGGPGLLVNWRVFGGQAAWIRKDRLETLELWSEGNADLVAENSIQSVILAYHRVLVEKERLDVLAEVLELSADRYDYELSRQEMGLSVSFDVLQAKNAYLSDSSVFLLQELNLTNAYRNLNLLLNKPLEERPELSDVLEAPQIGDPRDQLLSRIQGSNTQIRALMLNQALASQQTRLMRSALFPTLDLRAGIDYSWGNVKFEQEPAIQGSSYDYYANFTLSFTLFKGGQVRRAIREAILDEKIAEYDLASATQSIQYQAMAQYDLYVVRGRQLEVANENLNAASLNLRIAGDKLRNGTINSFNYREVQLVYLNASMARITAVYDLVESHTQLARLSGRLLVAE